MNPYPDLERITVDDIMKGVREASYEVFFRQCPGTIMEQMRTGVPWFGIKLVWIENEIAFRLMVLLDADAREESHRRAHDILGIDEKYDPKAYWRNLKGEARSRFGPPHFLLRDLFEPRWVKFESIDGVNEKEQGWQWRYVKACFLYRLALVIRKFDWLRVWS